MDERISRFRALLRRKQFAELDDTWLELLGTDVPVEDLLGLADLVLQFGPEGKSAVLLSLLADSLGEQSRHRERLDVLRRLLTHSSDGEALAGQFAESYRQLHADSAQFERILQKSGLGYGEPLASALPSIERYLALTAGRLLYSPATGPVRVTELDLLLDRVTIEEADGTTRTLPVEEASGRFRPVRPDGFYDLSARRPEVLARLAAERPGEVVRLYLRDVRHVADTAHLKAALAVVSGPDGWDAFWERARREVQQDPHVRIHQRPTRAFEWSDRRLDKTRRASIGERGDTEGLPSAAELAGLSPPALVAAFRKLTRFAQRRAFLERIGQAGLPDTVRLLSELFVVTGDRRARGFIEKKLGNSAPAVWKELLERIATEYRQNPGAFVWLAANAVRLGSADLPGILSRGADLLETASHRRHWSALRSALADRDYRLVRAGLAECDLETARRFLDSIGRARALEQYRKDEIAGIAAELHPSLTRDKPDDSILNTRAGIDRARDELDRLVREDLPRTAEEIARARAHGDLSENYEYKAAKEKQARLMARVNRMKQDLARAVPLDPAAIDTSVVTVGCRVRLSTDDTEAIDYSVLGPWDSDPDNGIISHLAPLGRQLLGRKPGDSVELDGRRFTIEKIDRAV